ncbi:acylphosphatase-1 isoform X2 [Varanus komodoensis]|uniref:acylphosphatase-1 isoform X2 n=1 Tax=Varanus komodoensis TaxID=61221 RepID=UPI001CF770EB|nr:acylphosphatase-1 isoform X2 [Varanus komodoensis]
MISRFGAVRGCCCATKALSSDWLARRRAFSLVARLAPATMAEGDGLVSVDYEVFGKVQGVFFRKHTQAQGKKLGVVGWVQNTDYGSVRGQIQGPTAKVRQLQEWLKKTGSPKSEIDRAEFRNEKKIARLEHSDFCIVK